MTVELIELAPVNTPGACAREVGPTTDQFRISEDCIEEDIEDVLTAEPPEVDADNPGFLSLITLLMEARAGNPDRETLSAYIEGLSQHLDDARDQVTRLHVDPAIAAQAQHMLAATEAMFARMEAVLVATRAYLTSNAALHLDEAMAALEAIHHDTQSAFRRM